MVQLHQVVNCIAGRENECKKTTYKEIGSFTFGTASAIYGGTVGNSLAIGTCSLVLGLASIEIGGAGALVCGLVGTLGGGYYSGEYGGNFGGKIGTLLYKATSE